MELLVDRSNGFLREEYTISPFYINGRRLCEMLEDKVRDFNRDGDLLDEGEKKIYGKTAIPYGRSRVVLTMSSKFKRLLPLIVGVKHFEGVRIHKMGTDTKPGTAGWSEGCLGPGENKVKGGIINSEKYEMIIVEKILGALLRGEEVWIEII